MYRYVSVVLILVAQPTERLRGTIRGATAPFCGRRTKKTAHTSGEITTIQRPSIQGNRLWIFSNNGLRLVDP
jgi:hypothetical protein